MTDHLPSAVVVVVPARDEEDLLPRCLASLAVASRRVAHLGVRTEVVVVADSCTDRTADVANAAGASVLEVLAGRVGAARAAGVRHGLGPVRADLHTTWLAHTDADSVVPADWLVTQLQHATRGADAVLGTVRLAGAEDGEPVPAAHQPLVDRWAERYVAQLLPDLTHPHVHGANLGVRADAYLAVGGFDDLDLHEDHVLAARLREAGHHVVTTSLDPVVTSHRLRGRVDGGVSTDLRSA